MSHADREKEGNLKPRSIIQKFQALKAFCLAFILISIQKGWVSFCHFHTHIILYFAHAGGIWVNAKLVQYLQVTKDDYVINYLFGCSDHTSDKKLLKEGSVYLGPQLEDTDYPSRRRSIAHPSQKTARDRC